MKKFIFCSFVGLFLLVGTLYADNIKVVDKSTNIEADAKSFVECSVVMTTSIGDEIKRQKLETEKKRGYIAEYVESEKAVYSECRDRVSRVVNETEKPKKNNKVTKSFNDPVDVSKIKTLELNKVYMNIRCDAINLHTKVFYGDDGNIIEYGVGQYAGSGCPGDGRMILLDSHNHTYFKPLENMKIGNEIVLETFYGNYTYTVFDIKVYNENDLESYAVNNLANNEEILVLYTCYPFKKTSYRKYQRYVVFAK